MVPDGSVWWEPRRTAPTFGWPPGFCSGGTSLAETVGLEKSMLKKILHYSDIGVALLMVLVVVMMVIPLPTGLIDVLLAANITLGVVVLLVTFYVKRALDLSVFPTLLLIVTLFRIALNVSTTRLILLNGYAGEIIMAFGNFVVGGNYIVGVVIFLILVIIQLLVITKGAERVAEVAARFTLDAMPGKQMAIDADLNSGLIDDQEARARRKDIQREADFYGAMDGASKFVKGDAVAGLIITMINIVGGLSIGRRALQPDDRRRRPGLPDSGPALLHGHGRHRDAGGRGLRPGAGYRGRLHEVPPPPLHRVRPPFCPGDDPGIADGPVRHPGLPDGGHGLHGGAGGDGAGDRGRSAAGR